MTFSLTGGGGGFAVLVKWTKSRQLAHYVVPLGRVVGSSLCPVLALRKLVDSYASSQPHQPLFSLPGSPFSPLSAPVARSWLRQALAAADLDPTLYSFHSLRRGGGGGGQRPPMQRATPCRMCSVRGDGLALPYLATSLVFASGGVLPPLLPLCTPLTLNYPLPLSKFALFLNDKLGDGPHIFQ